MKVTLIILSSLVLATLCSSNLSLLKKLSGVPNPVNVGCMLTYCVAEVSGCMLDGPCREAVACAKKCWSEWDNDTTSEKYHVQNCSNTCAFSYRDKAYLGFMECVGDHKCMSFPPIPSQCRAPDNISILKKLATKDLQGSWWVVGGRHPVYDCYPCQHLFFDQVNATTWKYQPRYYVYLANNSLALINEPYFIPNTTAGSPVSFVYHDAGLYHNETWWLIDGADDGSYVLLYYCGNTLEWYYDGALVLSREQTLPDSSLAAIATAYKVATGLDYSKFCKTQTKNCGD